MPRVDGNELLELLSLVLVIDGHLLGSVFNSVLTFCCIDSS